MAQPTEDPSGISLLADGMTDWSKLKIGEPWDYFQRPVPAAKAPRIPVAAGNDLLAAARWRSGGKVFHSGSINSGSTLRTDLKWSGLLKNVLAHFDVPIP